MCPTGKTRVIFSLKSFICNTSIFPDDDPTGVSGGGEAAPRKASLPPLHKQENSTVAPDTVSGVCARGS